MGRAFLLGNPHDFLAVAGKWPLSTAIGEMRNHPLFPTVPGNCCAEVVLESSTNEAKAAANNLFKRAKRVALGFRFSILSDRPSQITLYVS
jgi:hypothetical protein